MSDRPILIAYDGSEDAKTAITTVGELLTPGRALVVTVWHPAERSQVDRLDAVGTQALANGGGQPHVEADADDEVRRPRRLATQVDEDAAELAAGMHDVVRPLQ